MIQCTKDYFLWLVRQGWQGNRSIVRHEHTLVVMCTINLPLKIKCTMDWEVGDETSLLLSHVYNGTIETQNKKRDNIHSSCYSVSQECPAISYLTTLTVILRTLSISCSKKQRVEWHEFSSHRSKFWDVSQGPQICDGKMIGVREYRAEGTETCTI